jgi:hypothetical protein
MAARPFDFALVEAAAGSSTNIMEMAATNASLSIWKSLNGSC